MRVLSIIVRRLLLSVPLLFLVSLISFVLASIGPGDVAGVILSTGATEERRAQVIEQLGLDRSLPEQYWSWLTNALSGDLGTSLFSGESVTGMLSNRVPVTLSLTLLTLVLSVTVGIALGVASAIRGGAVARVLDSIALVAMAVPSFWFAAILVYVFVIALPWFPASGYVPFGDSPSLWLKSLALPVFCLATSAVAGLALQMRGQMTATFQSDYVRALRANGLPTRSVLYRHVLKNASGPVITVSGLLVVTLLGGTVLMETIFGMAGLGTLAVQATARHDLPVIQGVVVYFTVIVIIVNLLTDLAQAALNPRVVVE